MRHKNVFSGNIRRKWINLSQSKNSQKKQQQQNQTKNCQN